MPRGRISRYTEAEQRTYAERAHDEGLVAIAKEANVTTATISRWRNDFGFHRQWFDPRPPKPEPVPRLNGYQWDRVVDEMWAHLEEQTFLRFGGPDREKV